MKDKKKTIYTSWEKHSKKYTALLEEKKSYFHEAIIFPKVLKLLQLKSNSKLLELGCGQGKFSRKLPKFTGYMGLDASPSLINYAIETCKGLHVHFQIQDVTEPFDLNSKFTHGLIILALQNMHNPESVIKNLGNHIKSKGKVVIVLNHPCFRIPKHSQWHINESKNSQSRLVNNYLSRLKIPILMNPGETQKSVTTYSFHYPIQTYTKIFFEQGFLIQFIEEWPSEKKSVGTAAERENKAREEFPMFLTFVLEKR